jgi:multicomponent Na+:H+ antiporter subunit E
MRLPRSLGAGAWLVALWLLLWGDLSVANLAAGALVATVVLVVTGSTTTGTVRAGWPDPVAAVRFLAVVIVQLVRANAALAWEIVTPRDRTRPGVVTVPLHARSDVVRLVVANVITLTPGTLLLDVRETDDGSTVLDVHVLHLSDPDRVRRELLGIERLAVRALSPHEARSPQEGGAR